MINAAGEMNLSERVKRAMVLISEAMNSACYIYGAYFGNNKELYEAGSEEKLAELMYYLLPIYLS